MTAGVQGHWTQWYMCSKSAEMNVLTPSYCIKCHMYWITSLQLPYFCIRLKCMDRNAWHIFYWLIIKSVTASQYCNICNVITQMTTYIIMSLWWTIYQSYNHFSQFNKLKFNTWFFINIILLTNINIMLTIHTYSSRFVHNSIKYLGILAL